MPNKEDQSSELPCRCQIPLNKWFELFFWFLWETLDSINRQITLMRLNQVVKVDKEWFRAFKASGNTHIIVTLPPYISADSALDIYHWIEECSGLKVIPNHGKPEDVEVVEGKA